MTLLADQDRFLALLEEHKRILYKVANAYCRNREDRPDLIQEMVAQLWRSFERFDGRVRFSTWMYRIAMNVAISFYRSEGRRIRDAAPLEEQAFDLAAADRVSESVSDDVRLLQQLIHGLNEMDRALIILSLDGYSHDEIAEILGISPSNVSTRIHRIKQRLQREFDALQPQERRRTP
jgi:RNA polymerase sigma factor (sigma-70 family)